MKSCLKRLLKRVIFGVKYFWPIPKRLEHVIVITEERSGSTFFLDALGAHPSILCDPHDFYSPQRVLEELPLGKMAFTRKYCRCYKLKITESFDKLDIDQLVKQLAAAIDRGAKVIHLLRYDVIEQCLSSERVAATKILHRREGAPKAIDFDADVERLGTQINYYLELKHIEEQVLRRVKHFAVVYEKQLQEAEQQKQLFDACFEFLGLPTHAITSRYKKSASVSNAAQLKNLNAVIQCVESLRRKLNNSEKLKYLDSNSSLSEGTETSESP